MEKILLVYLMYIRWTPHSVVVTTKDSKDYVRVLLDFYTSTKGCWVLLKYTCCVQIQALHSQFGGRVWAVAA